MINVILDSANGPKVVATENEDEQTILAALPAGWSVNDSDWNNGVKLIDGSWAYPLEQVHPEHWTAKSDEERDAEIVRRLLAAGERDKALEIARERIEHVWVADDGNAAVAYPDAVTRDEAAREYVDDGSWGDDRSTSEWVTI